MRDPAKVRMIVLDVDGVMTDGTINLDENGREFKRYHVRDGYAIKAWMRMGFEVGVISGRGGGALRARMSELGLTRVVECCPEKGVALEQMCRQAGVPLEHTAFMGDDLPDLPALRRAGYAMTVADGVEQVRAICDLVTRAPGGHAAVREAIEHLARARGVMQQWLARYD
ncbi:MAG: HAD-IIIA family hydrolase [Leptolyngbya sp. PLA3]|nr:MAG: HAD-IIIA family hydrolase [Cyanobacteria bacterium CYA]MCE7969273.1 HAD-IIIA family hydrolase [Leptolyngbya sp. PL-A3]